MTVTDGKTNCLLTSVLSAVMVLQTPAVTGDTLPLQAPVSGTAAMTESGMAATPAATSAAAAGDKGEKEVTELRTIKGDFSKTGREIMDEVYRRHQQYPYVYEQQTMIMVDHDGLRDTRKLLRYSRVEPDGGEDFMLVFVSPLEVKGAALLAHRNPAGRISKSVYLPALGEKLIKGEEEGENSSFLGSDFAVEDLTGEVLDNYFYVRRQDQKIGDANYFVVDVYHSKQDARDKKTLWRHFIRSDNYFITETDYYDRHGRLYKRKTSHDLKHLEGKMWRANMILMENLRDQHKTLIKIDQRIYSRDYVPREMFTAQWLYKNYPDRTLEDTPAKEDADENQAETGTPQVHIAVSDKPGEAMKP